MTLEIKGYLFEVLLPDGKSAVLAEEVKYLDWRMRNAKPNGSIPDETLRRVRELSRTLLQI
jgi:mRNA interferase MazF